MRSICPHDGVSSAQHTLCRIGSHNVCLACLQMHVGAAACSAGKPSRLYVGPFGLIVSVGGHLPSAPANMRQEHVLVSKPVRQYNEWCCIMTSVKKEKADR
ncbi:hypothetical protein M3J09_007999 [Ascochyta lentis]